ncbi:phosphoprotein phosphatase [Tritrichomonas foetus]|uniref:Phosphoprotein phosphatase n=1 Tax=Tritrichomonas foetus TaxID=1144522 RepID=A0A1J4J252_9EUKA|nr:phosphoprotein phosphatase [Tritrichomonas foetus]|eukprot:OHS93450.1 phosphoprotein phosphatase [Tritrichomonas foetus]
MEEKCTKKMRSGVSKRTNAKPHGRRVATQASKGNQKVVKRAVPKSEMNLNVDKTFNFSTLTGLPCEHEVNIKFSKPFQETPAKDHLKLFLEKCEQCSLICDFSSNLRDQKSKTAKTHLLKHLAAGFTLPHLVRTINQDAMKSFYKMLSINLFRPIPKVTRFTIIETNDCLYDYAWPHLSLLYDCLKQSFNCKFSQNISSEFIYHLIGNAASPDERERIAVRDILHSMYTKFMNLRTVVREKIADQFGNGVCSAELLEFFVSVVSGFNSPLIPEHVTFFTNSVLPLHTLQDFPVFATQVKQLIIRYISKSGFLLDPTIDYLLKHWPKCHRAKQGLFLKEIEELFVAYEIHITGNMASRVFRLVGEMSNNMNTDVAETAVDILTNPNIAFTLKTHAHVVFPLVVEPVYRSAQKHWDDCIRTNAIVTLQTLSEIDKAVFSKVNESLKLAKTQKTAEIGARKINWTKIADAAKANDRNIKSIDFDGLK